MKYLIIVLLSILVLVLSYLSINTAKDNQKLKLEYKTLSTEKNKLSQTVSMYEVIITQDQKQLKAYTDSIFNMDRRHKKEIKEVKAYYSSAITTKIDSIPVPYVDTVFTKKWSDSVLSNCKDVVRYYEDSTVLIGTKAKDSTKYYNVDMTVQKQGVMINSIQFIDTQHIRIVTVKGGLFKKKGSERHFYVRPYTRVEVLHTNPYFINKGAEAALYTEKPRHHFLKGILTGAGGYFIITKVLPLFL